MTLFDRYPPNPDALYAALRDGSHAIHVAVREHVDRLWTLFAMHADAPFLDQIARAPNFHSRFWEMYFTAYLVVAGHSPSCPKPGPDVRLTKDGGTVVFEATAPTPGDPALRDSVPPLDIDSGESSPCPDPRTILRYRQAFREKADTQYHNHLAEGLITGTDPYVIALNGGSMLDSRVDRNTGILASLFGLGAELAQLGPDGRVSEVFLSYYPITRKTSGGPVATDVFRTPNHSQISAVLFSGVDAANPLELTGQDFVFIHNPYAVNPVPTWCLPEIREWVASFAPNGDVRLELRPRSPT